MQYEKYLSRIGYLRELVIKERTGTPKELAKKLGISEAHDLPVFTNVE